MWNFTSVRLRVRVFAVLLAALILLPFATGGAAADTVSVTGTYMQREAREVRGLINDFRKGKDESPWYWNETNTEKIQLSGLGELTYDYNLEKIAMQRAAEIAVKFSHTRPNGKSCFSLKYNGIQSYGENIAWGQSTDKEAFIAFREDDDDYEGQGHRRNMLNPDYTCVGLAHFVVNGKNFYVQEFGYSNSGTGSTSPVNGTMTVEVETQDLSPSYSLRLGASEITISYSGQTDLPTVELTETIASKDTTVGSSEYTVSWSSGDEKRVTIQNQKIIAVGIGESILTVNVQYKNTSYVATCKVKVVQADLSGLEFENIPDQTYKGVPVELKVGITVNGIGLQMDKDYTISYKNNNGPGTASFTITGKGNYTGSKTVNFKIVSDGSQPLEPTKAPKATNTPAPTKTPTKAPTKAPTATPSPKPAKTPTPKPTNTPIPKATNTPTPTVTPVPTEEPSPTPEATPTEEPVPTEELLPTPTEELTPTLTQDLTPTPAEELSPTPKKELTPAGELTPTPMEEIPPTDGTPPTEYDQTLLLPRESSVTDKGNAEADDVITDDSAVGSSGSSSKTVWLFALIPATLIGAVITGTVLVLRKRG
ncbi:MAG: hypothetical protein K6E71_08750 [Lachnospiraceae bacterium]|nr:hypothetical protein [Lachnospiraceae bacterium]